jgi:hypothetical protein
MERLLLYRALDCEYINKSQSSKVYDLASECRKQVKGFQEIFEGI